VTVPMLRDIGHHVATLSSSELDLFDPKQVRSPSPIPTPCCTWLPRIPTPDRKKLPGAWDVNDRLRAHANISKRDLATGRLIFRLGFRMSPARAPHMQALHRARFGSIAATHPADGQPGRSGERTRSSSR
jgi:hypothetical protein